MKLCERLTNFLSTMNTETKLIKHALSPFKTHHILSSAVHNKTRHEIGLAYMAFCNFWTSKQANMNHFDGATHLQLMLEFCFLIPSVNQQLLICFHLPETWLTLHHFLDNSCFYSSFLDRFRSLLFYLSRTLTFLRNSS